MSNHDREGSHPSNRDATLERAWREASDEQPPAYLDAAIVAAARQSVAVCGQQATAAPARSASRTWLKQWQSLAAAASVAGLAFVLVQMLPREHERAPSTQRQESAPVATESLPQALPAPAAIPAPPTKAAPPASKAEANASDNVGLGGDSSVERRQAGASEMSDRAGPAAAAAPAAPAMTSERTLGNAAPLDAAAWAARIATLHAAGDVTAAEHALREFRAAEPDADTYLPESLRSWARTVE